MTGEFYIEGQGDAALHEAILEAGDHAAAEAVSVAVLIDLGIDPSLLRNQ